MNRVMHSPPQRRVKTTLPPEYQLVGQEQGGSLAPFLGLFSLALGVAELVAPRRMAELTGVQQPTLLRAYGVREIVSGLGILAHPRPADWLWSRVAGDALDLSTLADAYGSADGEGRRRIAASAAAVLGVMALDLVSALQHDAADRAGGSNGRST